jgi:hypothetical protein
VEPPIYVSLLLFFKYFSAVDKFMCKRKKERRRRRIIIIIIIIIIRNGAKTISLPTLLLGGVIDICF